MEDGFDALEAGGFGAQCVAGLAQALEPRGVFFAVGDFYFLANALRQGGTLPVGGDGDLQVAALDYRAVIKMAVFNVVDGVAENAASFAFLKDGAIHAWGAGGGDGQTGAV